MAHALQAVGTMASGTGDVTPVWPTHVSNDIGILCVSTELTDSAPPAPAGWTQFTASPATATSGTRLSVFWRRAASSAETDPTIADVGNHIVAVIAIMRGCARTGDPFSDVVGDGSTGTSATCTWPAVTATFDESIIVLIASRATDLAGAQFSGFTNANLSNLTEHFDDGAIDGSGSGIVIAAGELATAGATGTTTATIATATNTARIVIAFTSVVVSATLEAIRDRMIALVEAIAPSLVSGVKFRHSQDEFAGDFQAFAESTPAGAFRRFQVRHDGRDETPEVSMVDQSTLRAVITLTFAYPHDKRAGGQGARDRDDCIDADWRKINYAVGLYGRANFSGTNNCTVYRADREIVRGESCDFLVAELELYYVLDTDA